MFPSESVCVEEGISQTIRIFAYVFIALKNIHTKKTISNRLKTHPFR